MGVSELKNDEAFINGIGRFDIEVTGNVVWSQNGKELAPNSQILKFEMITEGKKQSLIVKNVTKSDFCKYTANCDGQKKEASLTQKKPFVKSLQNVDGYVGGIAVFECQVHTGLQVTWYYGSKKINRQNFSMLKFEEHFEGNTRKLIVKNIVSKDYSEFSCEAKGEKTTAKLCKQSPWVEKLSNAAGFMEGIAVFQCKVHPSTHVSWYIGNKQINKKSFSILKYEELWDGDFRKLLVKNITKSDLTDFSCEAKGDKTTAKLTTMSPWVEKLSNAEGFIGNIAVFQCKVHPAVPVTWYVGNKKIEKKTFSILKYEEQWSGDYRQLLVKNITKDEFCEFSCEAKGDKCKAKLTKMSPWVEKLENAEGPVGGIAVFEVMVRPATQVTWYFGSKKIEKKNFSILKYEANWDGDWRKLLVKNITDKDYTEFSCEANGEKCKAKLAKGSGKKESRSANKKTAVTAKTAAKTGSANPKTGGAAACNDAAFKTTPKNATGKMQQIEVFECQMKNPAQEVCWYKEDKKINAKSFSILKFEDVVQGATRKLLVKNISAKDAGNYYCEAVGANSKVTCKLTVGKGTKSGSSARTATSDIPQSLQHKSSTLGLYIPPNLTVTKIREYVLTEALNRDIALKKKWIRSPDSWNQWIRNPEA